MYFLKLYDIKNFLLYTRIFARNTITIDYALPYLYTRKKNRQDDFLLKHRKSKDDLEDKFIFDMIGLLTTFICIKNDLPMITNFLFS